MSGEDEPKLPGFLAALVGQDRRRYQCQKGHVTVGRFGLKVFGSTVVYPPNLLWESGPICPICMAQKQVEGCEAAEIDSQDGGEKTG